MTCPQYNPSNPACERLEYAIAHGTDAFGWTFSELKVFCKSDLFKTCVSYDPDKSSVGESSFDECVAHEKIKNN